MTIEELQNKETWTEEDYQHSLELLREDIEAANKVYLQLESELFYNILDFEAGWSENFWALLEETRIKYRAAFLNL
jgi:hypothetical protein